MGELDIFFTCCIYVKTNFSTTFNCLEKDASFDVENVKGFQYHITDMFHFSVCETYLLLVRRQIFILSEFEKLSMALEASILCTIYKLHMKLLSILLLLWYFIPHIFLTNDIVGMTAQVVLMLNHRTSNIKFSKRFSHCLSSAFA